MKKSAPSTCSAASEGSALDLREPDLFGQLPSVSKTPTPSASLKSTGPKSQYTTMSEPSTQMDLEELTSSVAGSPASPGVSPGSSEAQKMTAISGQRWLPLLKSYGLSGSLAKTCEALLTSPWGSSAAFLTWKASGTKPFHLLFQLAPLTPRTAGTGSGLWQTPNANEDRAECYTLETSYKHRQEGRQIHLAQEVRDQRLWPKPRKMIPTPTASDHIERTSTSTEAVNPLTGKSVSLDRFVRFWPDQETQESGVPRLWATPRTSDIASGRTLNEKGQRTSKSSNLTFGANLADQVKMWPTPQARDWKDGKNPKPHGNHSPSLPVAVSTVKMYPTPDVGAAKGRGQSSAENRHRLGGSLNPTWVEWLMGFPTGWTDLNASETQSSRKSLSKSDGQSWKDNDDDLSRV
jgi:hypothetical protein